MMELKLSAAFVRACRWGTNGEIGVIIQHYKVEESRTTPLLLEYFHRSLRNFRSFIFQDTFFACCQLLLFFHSLISRHP
jgi:hypothetical protein